MIAYRCDIRVFVLGIGLLLAGSGVSYAAPAGPQQEIASARADEESNSALAVFKERILPIFRSPEPSSCMECHLGFVDLKDYISADQGETFAADRKTSCRERV